MIFLGDRNEDNSSTLLKTMKTAIEMQFLIKTNNENKLSVKEISNKSSDMNYREENPDYRLKNVKEVCDAQEDTLFVVLGIIKWNVKDLGTEIDSLNAI